MTGRYLFKSLDYEPDQGGGAWRAAVSWGRTESDTHFLEAT